MSPRRGGGRFSGKKKTGKRKGGEGQVIASLRGGGKFQRWKTAEGRESGDGRGGAGRQRNVLWKKVRGND